MPSESGEALARVPMAGDIVMPTRASNIGATLKEASRWSRPNPTENVLPVATSPANGWPTTKPQTRTIMIAGTPHAAARAPNSSRCSFMTSLVRGAYFAASIGTGLFYDEAGRDPKREVRTRGVHSRTIPPPPKFHPSKNTASFTAASGQLSRPSRGRA
jgi:hypothetical protein